MKNKQISKMLVIINIIIAGILTLTNLKLLCLLLGINEYIIILKEITIVFPIYMLSYSITLCIIPPIFERIFEYIYIKSNEMYDSEMKIKYYRELIEQYSIGALIKCYGKKVSYRDELVAILLKLLLNKKVEINGEKIKVIEEIGLSYSETMFIRACQGIKRYQNNTIKSLLKENNNKDALKTDLFSKDSINSYDIHGFNIKFSVTLWVVNFLTLILAPIIYEYNGLAIIIAFISHFLTAFSMIFLRNKLIMYRTQKGKEIQYKLIGLKNFLKEYSNISDRSVEEIKIWDEYIIYAIIFNLKGKLNMQSYNMYKKYIEKLIY